MYDVDMYGWIEEINWDNALKLAQHMRSIPYADIEFTPDSRFDISVSRDESRMTQFSNCLDLSRMINDQRTCFALQQQQIINQMILQSV